MALDDMGTRWKPTVPQTPVAPSIIDLAGLTAGALNADLIAAVDVSVFREFALQISGVWVGTLTFQGSNDGLVFYPLAVVSLSGGPAATTTTVPGIFLGYLPCKYFSVAMTAYGSGEATGVLRLSTHPLSLGFYSDAKPPLPPVGPRALGDNYSGGVVFYLSQEGDPGYDPDAQHGLIVLESDWSAGAVSSVVYTLNMDGSSSFGTSPDLGSGAANTLLIAQQSALWGSEANVGKVCAAITSGGYTDWYCGSAAEIDLWIASGFASPDAVTYWSSSECDPDVDDPIYYGRAIDIVAGAWLPAEQMNGEHHVRPFRSF